MRTVLLSFAMIACFAVLTVRAADEKDKDKDTAAAAKTRKLLKTKISVDFNNTRMADIRDELMSEVKGLRIMLDNKGGVSNNQTLTYKAKDKTVEQILDEMLKKPELGYVVISDPRPKASYDGVLMIRKSGERGYPEKKK